MLRAKKATFAKCCSALLAAARRGLTESDEKATQRQPDVGNDKLHLELLGLQYTKGSECQAHLSMWEKNSV